MPASPRTCTSRSGCSPVYRTGCWPPQAGCCTGTSAERRSAQSSFAYLEVVESAFNEDIDYATLAKIYRSNQAETRYSPALCIGCETKIISGAPDPKHVGTSYVERQNLTMRMSMRRFTRLTNGLSKKLENHAAMVSLY